MSRILSAPIQVVTRPSTWPGARGPEPVSFLWRGGRYRVTQVLDSWSEAGRWWEREPAATAWRVQVQDRGVMELVMLHEQPPRWVLVKVWD